MKKRIIAFLLAGVLAASVLSGCGKNETKKGSSASTEKDVQISTKELVEATDYDAAECVTLNDYSKMSVQLDNEADYDVTESDIEDQASQYFLYYPDYKKTSKKKVAKKDIVNIDYEGKMDGKTFDGGTATGAHLEIGSGSFIDGFEDGLIGKKVGDTVTLDLTFPKDYSDTDKAGKAVTFTVTINSIDKKVTMTYDALTDEYVANNFASMGLTTVDTFKSQMKSAAESTKSQQKQQDIQTAVLAKLVKECKVTLPKGLLEKRIQEFKDNVKSAAKTANSTYKDYIKSNYNMTQSEFNKKLKSTMKDNLTQELILEAIVEDQKITISTNDFNSFVSQYVSYYGYTDTKDFYDQMGGEKYVKLSYAENQALSKVVNSTSVTYKKAKTDSDTTK